MICIAVDGCRASALGTYANTWQPTAFLDRLASVSLVLDWMWNVYPENDAIYRQLWSLPDPAHSTVHLTPGLPCDLPSAVVNAGGRVALVTDDPTLVQQVSDLPLSELLFVPPVSPGDAVQAESSTETELARLFATAAEFLPHWVDSAADQQPSLLWIDARGWGGLWDAPAAYRQRGRDAQDPPAPAWIVPPTENRVTDPDEQFAWRLAYAAQVAVLDECCEALAAAMNALPLTEPPRLLLVGKRGFPLGEHATVGWGENRLFSELLHIPCLLAERTRDWDCARDHRLATLGDVPVAVLRGLTGAPPQGSPREGAGGGTRPEEVSWPWADCKEMAIRAGNSQGDRVLRAASWMLLNPQQGDPQLYIKPDDRWEFNDVASRCPQVVDSLLPHCDDPTAPLGAVRLERDLIERIERSER
jgi:hypothetical protein